MIISYIQKLIDIVLPPRCPITGHVVDSHGTVSADGWKNLSFITKPYCDCCGFPFEFSVPETGVKNLCAACLVAPQDYDCARSSLVYNDQSRGFILRFKHGDQTQSVVAMMPWLYQAGGEFWGDTDVIIPVPLHRWRLLRRRYNQAALMAQGLSKKTKIPYIPDMLIRTRSTPVQGHLNASERKKNVASAFSVHPKYAGNVRGKKILMIDDVYTTGSTVNECAKVLKRSGAARVDVLTLARVVKAARV